MAMWAEPASRYWVIKLAAEIAGHLIVRAHVLTTIGPNAIATDGVYPPHQCATWTILGSNQ